MASGQVLVKIQHYYSKAANEIAKWQSTQNRMVSLVGTASNVMQRLPALLLPENFGSLGEIPEYKEKLFEKQVMHLEEIFGNLHAALTEMSLCIDSLEKICANAGRVIKEDKRMTPKARSFSKGPLPSVNQCMQGLTTLLEMFCKEQKLQEVLISEIRYGLTDEEMQELNVLLQKSIHIDNIEVGRILYTVEATKEAKG